MSNDGKRREIFYSSLYPSKIKGRGLVKFDDIFEFQSATFKCENKTDYI